MCCLNIAITVRAVVHKVDETSTDDQRARTHLL